LDQLVGNQVTGNIRAACENQNDRLAYSLASFIDLVAENLWTEACEIPYKRSQ